MARVLRQATSVDVPIGPFLDATDGVTAETALTITQPDVRLKKNAAAWAQKAAAQTLTHEENGNYEVTLDATDTDTLGLLRLHVAEAGAMPVWEDFMVIPANVWDSLLSAGLSEPAVGAIPAVADFATMLLYLFTVLRNLTSNDGSFTYVKADDGTTVLFKFPTSSAGGTVTKGEAVTGP